MQGGKAGRVIDHFVTHSNQTCHPFVWTATADSILAKLQRLCSRINVTLHLLAYRELDDALGLTDITVILAPWNSSLIRRSKAGLRGSSLVSPVAHPTIAFPDPGQHHDFQ